MENCTCVPNITSTTSGTQFITYPTYCPYCTPRCPCCGRPYQAAPALPQPSWPWTAPPWQSPFWYCGNDGFSCSSARLVSPNDLKRLVEYEINARENK